jgi:hypothetical protein
VIGGDGDDILCSVTMGCSERWSINQTATTNGCCFGNHGEACIGE